MLGSVGEYVLPWLSVSAAGLVVAVLLWLVVSVACGCLVGCLLGCLFTVVWDRHQERLLQAERDSPVGTPSKARRREGVDPDEAV
eukprot:m51a1_g1832 hypothetical protein (85) ;mRNA; f:544388-544642